MNDMTDGSNPFAFARRQGGPHTNEPPDDNNNNNNQNSSNRSNEDDDSIATADRKQLEISRR